MVRAMAKKCETANGVALDRQAADTAPLTSLATAAASPLFIAISGSCPVWHRID